MQNELTLMLGEFVAAGLTIIWLTQLFTFCVIYRRTRPMNDEELRLLNEYLNHNNKPKEVENEA